MSDLTKGAIFFIGVDVGTASVRAGLYSLESKSFAKTAVQPITVHRATINVKHPDRQSTEIISQSSTEIWNAVCHVVKEVTDGIAVDKIGGIGFDATCSLVVVGPDESPFDVDGVLQLADASGHATSTFLDVIMWQDHRATRETDFINEALADHPGLSFVGGKVSVEMEMPKLLWLKTHRPAVFRHASHFMDLCDFLSWKASGDQSRSMCSVVCKWLYQVQPNQATSHGWDKELLAKIGLAELSEDAFSRIGKDIRQPGRKTDSGVSVKAAEELGLAVGTAVATSLIDAHAGGLALAFCAGETTDMMERLAIISGTSTCYMQSTLNPVFVSGLWGPYYSAMIPNCWLLEGGQSAAGQFLDHIIRTHPFYIKSLDKGNLSATYIHLNERAMEMCRERHLEDVAFLTDQLHIFPDYHGNRSPLSSPDMKGMIIGLTLDGESEMSLMRLYLAAVQGLAYEGRWIMECMTEHGIAMKDLAICGGLANNPLFVKTLADVVGMPVVLPHVKESVILGAAILAAAASGSVGSVQEAARQMAGGGSLVRPLAVVEAYHTDRYRVFRKMVDFQLDILKH